MARRRAALGALCAAVLAALGGCGAGAGAATEGATLLVTRDFGHTVMLREGRPETRGSDTVMRLLARNAKVTTRYGGGFVQSIDGVAGGQEDGRLVDWFFYVDGVQAERGAVDVPVEDGAAIWWDHHDWEAGPAGGSAVVGSFPAPFSRARTTALACVPAGTDACAATADALRDTGTRVEEVPAAGVGRGDRPGVLVGTLEEIASAPGARSLREGPAASGVYARPSRDGAAIALLDERGRRVRTVGAGAGLVAATSTAGAPPVWVVTGTDRAGVRAAAGALDGRTLRARFAVAVAGGRAIALPEVGAR